MAIASTGQAITLSVLLTWIFKKTRGSVLLLMVFQCSNNANFNKMFAAVGEGPAGNSFMLTHALIAILFALLLVVWVIFRPIELGK